MGLFDFVRDAGKKLFGTAEETPDTPVEKVNEEAAVALAVQIRHLGFRVDELQVEYADGVATVHGKVASQREKEIVLLTLGNTRGVARVDDRLEVEAPEPQATLYTVQSGDTLSGIAKAHYGKGSLYMEIFEANRPMLEDPDRIYPGQVLRIPPREG